MAIEAVIFDMDGVLIDSEVYWALAREEFAQVRGKAWQDEDHRYVMGRATLEWAKVMQDRLELSESLEAIADEMIQRMSDKYAVKLPVRPGAVEAVKLAAQHYRVALASGSPTALIQKVTQLTGLDQVFETMVYGDDIKHGKPAPDIYIEALRRMGLAAQNAIGIEDSTNGICSLHAAGMSIIAAPSPGFPLSDDILALAQHKIDSLEDFSIALVQS